MEKKQTLDYSAAKQFYANQKNLTKIDLHTIKSVGFKSMMNKNRRMQLESIYKLPKNILKPIS